MWKPTFLPPQYHSIIDLNPLAQFLEILRNPLLGQPISSYAWLCTTVIALAGGLMAVGLIGRYKPRIIFWM
jgi:ABC-type polysaccharide/polyol phosphate export permease